MTMTEKKKARQKAKRQFYTLIAAAVIVGIVLGGFVVGMFKKDTNNGNDTALYGTRDGKTLTDEGILVTDGEEFIPLDCALSEELQEYTYYLCKAYYIDFDFAMAVMYTESAFRSNAISETNDYGLMQINTCNHAELADKLGINDFTDSYQNIRAGLYILRGLFEKYDDAAMVCMAYNMGEYGAAVLWEKGIYNTTYSNNVLTKADEYAAQRESK